MALLRKWYWNLTNTAIEHFSCRFLPLIYLLPEGWNIWQGWRGMRILVSFHHANACCSDGRWFSARVGVMMVTQYLSHIWGGWTSEGLWERNRVHNLEKSNCNPFEFWDYQIASPSLQSSWKSNIIVLISNFSVLCLFIYYLFPGCGPTQHSAKGCAPNEFMAAEIQFHFNTLHQKCLFEDYLQYQHQSKFNQDTFKKSPAKRQLLHFLSRCQVDLKRSAPDWPKAFWCTYWGPNMEPRGCSMSRS